MSSKLFLVMLLLLNVAVSCIIAAEESNFAEASNGLHPRAFPDLNHYPTRFQFLHYPLKYVKYSDFEQLMDVVTVGLAELMIIPSNFCLREFTVGTATFFIENLQSEAITLTKDEVLSAFKKVYDDAFSTDPDQDPGSWIAYMKDASETAINLVNIGVTYYAAGDDKSPTNPG